MKRILPLLLCLILLTGSAASQEAPRAALYVARLMGETQMLSEPVTGEPLARLKIGEAVELLEVYPDWLLIRAREQEGYIRRAAVDFNRVTTVDPAKTPRYPAVLSSYIGWVNGETPVRDAPSAEAAALVTLQDGAALAFIGIEDGWAKLIYHRQYGYVDSRQLRELQPVYADPKTADGQAPIAAYTSFYRTETDEVNKSRMVNIQVGIDRMERLTIGPDERFDFNAQVGPYNRRSGYQPAYVLVDGKSVLGYGGGTCQVSSTLFNTLMQLPGLYIAARRPHGPGGAKYLPLHADAAVGNANLNLRFVNLYPFPVRIKGSAQDGALTISIYRAD